MFVTKQLMPVQKDTEFTVSRDANLSVICYIAENFEAGNSLNLTVTAVVGQHSRVTFHCYILTSWIFCNVARLEILAGNSFIVVRCHVTSK